MALRDLLLKISGDPSDAREALDDVKDDLKAFDRISAEARAEIKTKGAEAQLKILNARLDNLSKQTASPKVDLATAKTLKSIERVERELEQLGDKTFTPDIKPKVHDTAGRPGAGAGSLGAGAAGGLAAKAGPIGAAFAALGAAGLVAVDTSADVGESISKNIQLFGEASKAVERFAETSAESLGISKKSALEATGVFGNLLVALGLGPEKSADMSVSLVKLAADLASFNNTSPEEALDALRAGLTGETEPLRKFGVNINDAALKETAVKEGLVEADIDPDKVTASQLRLKGAQIALTEATKKYGKESAQVARAQASVLAAEAGLSKAQAGKIPQLNAQQKALAAQALIFKQTAKAQGDFGRTSEGLANQTRVAKAELSNLADTLGEDIKPAAEFGVQGFVSLLQGAQKVFPELKDLVGDSVDDVRGFLRENKDDVDAVGDAFENVGAVVQFSLEEVVVPTVENTIDTIEGLIGPFTETIRGGVEIITGILTGDFGRAWTGVKRIFRAGINGAGAILTGAKDRLFDSGKAAGEGIKAGVRAGLDGLKGVGRAAINALIDVVNFGIRQLNKVLRPRDLGPLGKSPDLRIGEIDQLGGDTKKPTLPKGFKGPKLPSTFKTGFSLTQGFADAFAATVPVLGPATSPVPVGAAAGGSTVFGDTIVNLPPAPESGVPDPRYAATQIARELERRGRG